MTVKAPEIKSVAKVNKRLAAKAPKKNIVPRMQSTLSKKRGKDLAKQITKRNTHKITIVSNTIALEQDKLAMVLVPVQLDNEGSATQPMMLRRRKATQDMAKMMDKKRMQYSVMIGRIKLN
jgi:hypothetical protein